MKKFLIQKMAADPDLNKDFELGFHEESSELLREDGCYIKIRNKKFQQTFEKPLPDSKLYLGNEDDRLVKIDNQNSVDPEKQKILNTIFHYKNKKSVTDSDESDKNDSDNEEVVFLRSILKKEPKTKIGGKINYVHFGFEEIYFYNKRSSVIPKLKKPKQKSPKKNSKRRGNRRTKRGNSKTQVIVKEKNILQNNNNSKENEELTVAEQILLVKPAKNVCEKMVDNDEEYIEEFLDVEKYGNIICDKNKELIDIPEETYAKKRKSPLMPEDQQNKTVKILAETNSKSIILSSDSQAVLPNQKSSTRRVFENSEATQVEFRTDLHKKEIERAANLTCINLNKQPFVNEWVCSVKQFYPQK